jgi:hypothetical protein
MIFLEYSQKHSNKWGKKENWKIFKNWKSILGIIFNIKKNKKIFLIYLLTFSKVIDK